MEIIWSVSAGRRKGENGGKMLGLRSKISRQGDVKNSIGNIKAKELICMTHGHELRGGLLEERDYWVEGDKGGKWDNCNSIINKIYFLKNRLKMVTFLIKVPNI